MQSKVSGGCRVCTGVGAGCMGAQMCMVGGCRCGCRGGRLPAHTVGADTGGHPHIHNRRVQAWVAVQMCTAPGHRCEVGVKTSVCLHPLWSARVCVGQAGAVTRAGFSVWCWAGSRFSVSSRAGPRPGAWSRSVSVSIAGARSQLSVWVHIRAFHRMLSPGPGAGPVPGPCPGLG